MEVSRTGDNVKIKIIAGRDFKEMNKEGKKSDPFVIVNFSGNFFKVRKFNN